MASRDRDHLPGTSRLEQDERQKYLARNEEVVRYLPLIRKVISRLLYRFPPLIEAEDMEAVGALGLIEALERYEPGALPFQHYAEIRIRGAILDELRRVDLFSRGLRRKAKRLRDVINTLKNRLGRPPSIPEIAESMQLTVAEVEELRNQVQPVVFMEFEKLDYYDEQVSWPPSFREKSSNDPFLQMQHKEVRTQLKVAIEKLPERQRLILFLYYFEEMTLREIGELLSLSESRICQIHQKACRQIRTNLESEMDDT